MELQSVTLKHWCQHRSLKIEFRRGLNGILGSNGHGKSNLLDAIRFLFTGDSVNHGNKRDNLTWGETTGYVSGVFTIDGTEYELKRSIESSKAELRWGKERINKVDEIEAELTKLLANVRTMLDNVFIPQGKIDSILYARPTERLKEFQEACGLDKAADAHRCLSQEVNAYQVTSGLEGQVRQSIEMVSESRAAVKALEQELASIQRDVKTLEPAEQILRQAIEATRSQQAYQQAQKAVQDAQQELEAKQVAVAQVRALFGSQSKLMEQAQADEASRVVEIQAAELTANLFERTVLARGRLAELERLVALQPGPRVTRQQVDELQRQYHEAQAAEVRLRGYLADPTSRPKLPREQELAAKIDPAANAAATAKARRWQTPELFQLEQDIKRATTGLDDGLCPTCGQAVDGGPEAAAKRKQHLQHLTQQRDELAGRLKHEYDQEVLTAEQAYQALAAQFTAINDAAMKVLRDQHGQAVQNIQAAEQAGMAAQKALAWFDGAERDIQIARGQLADSPATAPDPEKLATLRAAQQAHQKFAEVFDDLRFSLYRAEKDVEAALKRVEDTTAFRDRLGTTIDMPDQATIAEAQVNIAKLSSRRVEAASAGQSLGIEQAKLGQRESDSRRLSEVLAREAKDAAWLTEVKKARDALHVTQLPAMAMREFARIINARMEYYLVTWEAPFRMWLDNDLAFRVKFPDGMELDAARLSGGQKVVASTSFRLAMSDTFARRVGLLVLDEPSNHLDKDNIQHLQALLLQLKNLSIHTGRQILIVTHEESLMGFLDHVVEIK